MFGENLTLDYINPAGEILYQASAKRLLGQSIDNLLSKETNLPGIAREAFESGNPIFERGVPMSFPSQETITVDCAITPISDSKSSRALLLELNHVDHSLRVSKEVNQLNQNSALHDLLRGLAHEVKNPLGGLRGAAQLLERELDDDSLKDYTNIIIGEADRLRNLVNRLLGPNTLPKQTSINIHEVTEHVKDLVKAELPDGVSLLTDYDPSIPEITGDRDQFIQAFLNVVGNAVQAVQSNGCITLRTRTLRQFVIGQTRYRLVCRVDVIDDGPGIENDMIERIFLPMVTTRAEGSGLGLSIAQSLIQHHRGIIQCKSKPGKTVFSFLLPIT